MLAYPISTAEDILTDDHLAAREFWQVVEQPGIAQPIRFPGAFAKFSAMECGVRRGAPALGEHNDAILGGELGFSAEQLDRMRAARII